MVPPCVDLGPTRLTVSPVTSGLVMSSNDSKRFICLDFPKFSDAIGSDNYFCLTVRGGCITLDTLSAMVFLIQLISLLLLIDNGGGLLLVV